MSGGACESGTVFWSEHLASWNLTGTRSWPQRQIFAVCQISPLPSSDVTVAITISKPPFPLLLQTQQPPPHTYFALKKKRT